MRRLDLVGLALLGTLLLGILAWIVVEGKGNVAWDDANYLYRGLYHANQVSHKAEPRMLRLYYSLLLEAPKPPLLTGWIATGALVFGKENVLTLILWSTVVVFAFTSIAVFGIANNLFGPSVARVATVCYWCSPLALNLAAAVMVETFMSLWILLALFAMARFLERPSGPWAMLGGLSVGLAMLTKASFVFLLGPPMVYFACAIWRQHRSEGKVLRYLVLLFMTTAPVAAPWYVRNAAAAYRFAVWAAGDVPDAAELHWALRILSLPVGVMGWPMLLVTVAGLLGLPWRSRAGGIGVVGTARRRFVVGSVVGAMSGTVVLLLPSYLEPRFLLPVWAAVSICVAILLSELRRIVVWILVGLALTYSVAATMVTGNYGRGIPYGIVALVDQLRLEYSVKRICNGGSTAAWNVYKLRLVNELRSEPRTVDFVDLSSVEPARLRGELEECDAILVLIDLPPEAAKQGLRLGHRNRSVGSLIGLLDEARPTFVRADVWVRETRTRFRMYVRTVREVPQEPSGRRSFQPSVLPVHQSAARPVVQAGLGP